MRKLLQGNSPAKVTKRGIVLRVPGAGPGLLMVQGQQFRFSLDETWRPSTPPKAGMAVEIELDRSFHLVAIFGCDGAERTKR